MTSPHRGEVGASAPGEGAEAHTMCFLWGTLRGFDAPSPAERCALVDLSPEGRGP